jgi:hypothetical protein
MRRSSARVRLLIVLATAGVALVSCRAARPTSVLAHRYMFSTSPIQVGVVSRALCVAFDPTDAEGVWWWEPGQSDCSSRSPGPGVFRAEDARVEQTRSGDMNVRFRLQLIRPADSPLPPFADVALVISNGRMIAPASGNQVAVRERRDLDIRDGVARR